MHHAFRVLMGLRKLRPVDDPASVESDDIGLHSGLEKTAVRELQAARGETAHLADRFLESEGLLVANITPKHSRECSIAAWMGRSLTRQRRESIRCHHRVWGPHDALDVVLANC